MAWAWGASPRRSRPLQAPTQVWKVKEHKKEKKTKRISFAEPIATELKAPKVPIQDDSIMLIKVPDSLNIKEKEWGQGLSSACTAIEKISDQHIVMEADATAMKDIQMEQHTEPGSMAMVKFNITPSKNAAVEMKKQSEHHIKPGSAVTVDFFPPTATDTEELTDERTSALLDQLSEFLHFARPMEKDTMEAIQGLIEQAYANQKKGQNKRNAVAVPERLA